MKKEVESRNGVKKNEQPRTAQATRTPTPEEWTAWMRRELRNFNARARRTLKKLEDGK